MKQLSFHILLLLLSWSGINTAEELGPTPPPLAPITPTPTLVKSVVLKGESHVEKVELMKPFSLELQCTWAGNQNKPANMTGYWRKDGEEIENKTVLLENEQYNLTRVFSIDNEKSLGNYSCAFGSEAKVHFILAAPQMDEERDKPIVSYVGDSVLMQCKMKDHKPKPNTWNWYKANGTNKELIDAGAEPRRYAIENDQRMTKLTVLNLTEADAGSYYCGAVYDISTSMSLVELRVITFMQPLKPFIAIVVEVLVLVAIILLYERSTSRRNSRAGDGCAQSDDQTNNLTQGESNGMEGSSSTRHRKI